MLLLLADHISDFLFSTTYTIDRKKYVVFETPCLYKYMIEDYLKYVPSDQPIKEECCEKYKTRPTGRYCHTCPDHPLRRLSITEQVVMKEKALSLLEKEDYPGFIELLKSLHLPHP